MFVFFSLFGTAVDADFVLEADGIAGCLKHISSIWQSGRVPLKGACGGDSGGQADLFRFEFVDGLPITEDPALDCDLPPGSRSDAQGQLAGISGQFCQQAAVMPAYGIEAVEHSNGKREFGVFSRLSIYRAKG